MPEKTGELKKEEYAEPRCVLCEEPYGADIPVRTVPQQRIREKLDSYMEQGDYDGAHRHLLYWMEEARLGKDLGGQLMLCNELIGFCRKRGLREEAFENGEEALRLLGLLGFDAKEGSPGSVSAGTTYVNYATACHVFEDEEKSLQLFQKAREIYESSPAVSASLLGGLYNNMGLTCAAMGRYEEAMECCRLALDQMKASPGGEPEQAITCLNMADILEAWYGMEQAEERIFALLDQAADLLERRDENLIPAGYYAYVCENCIPSFEHYGYFLAAQELQKRVDEIYREIRK